MNEGKNKRASSYLLIIAGGPGGSGIEFLLSRDRAQHFQTVIDAPYDETSKSPFSTSESARYFDILSFDPRLVYYAISLNYLQLIDREGVLAILPHSTLVFPTLATR